MLMELILGLFLLGCVAGLLYRRANHLSETKILSGAFLIQDMKRREKNRRDEP